MEKMLIVGNIVAWAVIAIAIWQLFELWRQRKAQNELELQLARTLDEALKWKLLAEKEYEMAYAARKGAEEILEKLKGDE